MSLYLSEEQIAEKVLGKGRLQEWYRLARTWETEGLPTIDKLTSGRFWPAVEAFFLKRHGVSITNPPASHGREEWTPRRSRRQGSSGAIKKCALRQTKDGTIISFVLHPHEDNEELINAPIGQVFNATFQAIED